MMFKIFDNIDKCFISAEGNKCLLKHHKIAIFSSKEKAEKAIKRFLKHIEKYATQGNPFYFETHCSINLKIVSFENKIKQ